MKTKVLFVCLGNICRSPSAEALFKAKVKQKGLTDNFLIDSAGIGGWHSGNPADPRMKRHAGKRGYNLDSFARKFDPRVDFDNFDYIIGMDDENIRDLKAMARNENDRAKIRKMTEFNKTFDYKVVPDPYYGGSEGFELVLDLLEDATEGLIEEISKKAN